MWVLDSWPGSVPLLMHRATYNCLRFRSVSEEISFKRVVDNI